MDIREAWQVFTDVWKFYKEFWEINNTDEYWDDVVIKADEICRENPSELKKALVLAVLVDMERRAKEI